MTFISTYEIDILAPAYHNWLKNWQKLEEIYVNQKGERLSD